jgi:hypothetical protein
MSDLNKLSHDSCLHEVTHRGGAIWTICDDCGRKWADDMSEHTPGPWRLNSDALLVGNDALKMSIAIAYDSSTAADGVSREEMKANARLIAAAPDLLEALKGALDSLLYVQSEYGDQVGGWGVRDDRIRKAREAIAKATLTY